MRAARLQSISPYATLRAYYNTRLILEVAQRGGPKMDSFKILVYLLFSGNIKGTPSGPIDASEGPD